MQKPHVQKTKLLQNQRMSLGRGFIDAGSVQGLPSGTEVDYHAGVAIASEEKGKELFEISFEHFFPALAELSTDRFNFAIGEIIVISASCEDLEITELPICISYNDDEFAKTVIVMNNGNGSLPLTFDVPGDYSIYVDQENVDAIWLRPLYELNEIRIEVELA